MAWKGALLLALVWGWCGVGNVREAIHHGDVPNSPLPQEPAEPTLPRQDDSIGRDTVSPITGCSMLYQCDGPMRRHGTS